MKMIGKAALAAILLAASARAGQAQQIRSLTIATHYTDEQMQPLSACFREYERENPSLRIAHRQSTYADFLQTILTARLSGNAPDIYNLYSIWGARLVGAGVLAKPPADIVRYVEESYHPTTRDAIAVRKEIWGVPSEVSAYMLIYNKKLFAEAGIDRPPATAQEWSDTARKLARMGPNKALQTAGAAFGQTVANAVAPFRTLMLSAGYPVFTEDGRGTNLSRPEAADILARQAALFRDDATSNAFEVQRFAGGAIGMMIMANWVKNNLQQGFGPAFADTVGVAPIPAGPDWRTYQYAFFYGVDARSRNRDEAWRFISWLNAPRSGQASCTGRTLARLGALTGHQEDMRLLAGEYADAFSKPFIDAVNSGRAVAEPNIARASESERILADAIRNVWAGRAEPAQALADADRRIRQSLADDN